MLLLISVDSLLLNYIFSKAISPKKGQNEELGLSVQQYPHQLRNKKISSHRKSILL